MSEYQKALEYHEQALSIARAIGDYRLEIFALREMGKVYESRGNKAKALKTYTNALSFYQSEKDLRGEADTLNLMGGLYEESRQGQKALACYSRALSLCRKADYPYGEASALSNVARFERASGNLTAARSLMEEAIAVIESLRNKVDSQELRASYLGSMRQHYESYIDLLMQLHAERPAEGFDITAFEASERARARSMLEILAAARVGIRLSADTALLTRESALRKELDEKTERRARLLLNKEAAQEVAALTEEVSKLAAQYRELSAQIRDSSSASFVTIQPPPLSLKEIQARAIDDDTLLLEYSLGDERSYLWAVTKTEINSYRLPARAEIEALANRLREAIIAPQMNEGEAFEQYRARLKEAEARYEEDASALSEVLLGPALAQMRAKRLIVVAEGALQYIPFSALPSPEARDAKPAPLMLEHEITYQPSASTLATLRGETARRLPGPKDVAIFADPVFEQSDPRLVAQNHIGSAVAQEQSRATEAHRALRSAGVLGSGQKIQRLFASSDEAEAIMAVTSAGSSLKATSFQASKAVATGPDMSQYRIIHFATHGVLNSESPELSGLMLSLFDKDGQPQDGFLGLNDIYNLSLPADLVVLSACNTGLGKNIKGEGLVGLTRGFIYAGAARVVATLWKVDDAATAELMKHFYEKMLRERKPPATALREAQIALWQQKRWRAPYYWAAFVLQGEYGQATIGLTAQESKSRLAAPVISLAVLLAGLYAIRLSMKKLRRS
jgi:CHAT domain-containing protein